jgi:hypothetical protein
MIHVLNAEGDPVPLSLEDLGQYLSEAGSLFEDMSRRRVAETLRDGVQVSTVFLMFDHKMNGNEPVLWETMVFGGEHDGYQERSRTLEEAVLHHRLAVRVAFPENPPETVWGTLPRLRPDGSVGADKVEQVLGESVWDRLLREEDLV